MGHPAAFSHQKIGRRSLPTQVEEPAVSFLNQQRRLGAPFKLSVGLSGSPLLTSPRRRSIYRGSALRRLPAIIGRTILEEHGILTVWAGRIHRVGLTEDLSCPQRICANLVDQLVIAFVGLRESRESAQVVVSNDHHIHSGNGCNVKRIGHAGRCLDHDHHQHVVIDGVVVVDTVDTPQAGGLPWPVTPPRNGRIARPLVAPSRARSTSSTVGITRRARRCRSHAGCATPARQAAES